MRDIFFIAVFGLLCLLAFRRPYIAVAMWVWIAMLVPLHWLYGFASGLRYNVLVALLALTSYAIYKEKPKVETTALFWLVIIFFLHTVLTSTFSVIGFSAVVNELDKLAKIILLFVMIVLILRTKNHIELLLYGIVGSIGMFGTIEGLKYFLSGGGHKIVGPAGHLLGDNNHLALAIAMTLPIMVYLAKHAHHKYIKLALSGAVIVCIMTILGTNSRGGFIGLVIVGLYFWAKSKRKVAVTSVLIVVLGIAAVTLPQSWFNRMQTIETATEDSSFSTRIRSWKMHTIMAMERPFTGGGFKAVQYGYVWQGLADKYYLFDFIDSGPAGNKGWAAHSNYFQVLGDHGFAGLFLYLSLIGGGFMSLASIQRSYKKRGITDAWQVDLSKMLRVSLVAYSVAGAAVSMTYFELFYVILGLIVCLNIIVKAEERSITNAVSQDIPK